MTRRTAIKRPNAFWWNISKFFVWSFSKVWFRLRVEGRENWPAEGPVIVVANHSSNLDPPMVGISSPRWLLFLAQAGLAKFGPARWWMARVGVTLIDRDAPSKEALRLLSDSLKAGHPVGIFPEGTRSKDGSVAPFRNGVEFLVRRTRAAILPVGIDGSYRAMPRKAWWPRPRKITVRFGEVWSPERLLAEGGSEALRQYVAELARVDVRASRSERGADRSTASVRSESGRSESGQSESGRSESGRSKSSESSEPSAAASRESRSRQSS